MKAIQRSQRIIIIVIMVMQHIFKEIIDLKNISFLTILATHSNLFVEDTKHKERASINCVKKINAITFKCI